MTGSLNVDPDGLAGFAATVNEHSGYVVGVSIPPQLSGAALGQGTGQASAVLNVLVAAIGAAMGRELSGVGAGSVGTAGAFKANEDQAAHSMKEVMGMVSGVGKDVSGAASGIVGPISSAISSTAGAVSGAASGLIGDLSKGGDMQHDEPHHESEQDSGRHRAHDDTM